MVHRKDHENALLCHEWRTLTTLHLLRHTIKERKGTRKERTLPMARAGLHRTRKPLGLVTVQTIFLSLGFLSLGSLIPYLCGSGKGCQLSIQETHKWPYNKT